MTGSITVFNISKNFGLCHIVFTVFWRNFCIHLDLGIIILFYNSQVVVGLTDNTTDGRKRYYAKAVGHEKSDGAKVDGAIR